MDVILAEFSTPPEESQWTVKEYRDPGRLHSLYLNNHRICLVRTKFYAWQVSLYNHTSVQCFTQMLDMYLYYQF